MMLGLARWPKHQILCNTQNGKTRELNDASLTETLCLGLTMDIGNQVVLFVFSPQQAAQTTAHDHPTPLPPPPPPHPSP